MTAQHWAANEKLARGDSPSKGLSGKHPCWDRPEIRDIINVLRGSGGGRGGEGGREEGTKGGGLKLQSGHAIMKFNKEGSKVVYVQEVAIPRAENKFGEVVRTK